MRATIGQIPAPVPGYDAKAAFSIPDELVLPDASIYEANQTLILESETRSTISAATTTSMRSKYSTVASTAPTNRSLNDDASFSSRAEPEPFSNQSAENYVPLDPPHCAPEVTALMDYAMIIAKTELPVNMIISLILL